MKNAMERTRKASGVFGRLIRQWTLEFDTDLPHRREPDGRLVIAAEVLRNILAEGRPGRRRTPMARTATTISVPISRKSI